MRLSVVCDFASQAQTRRVLHCFCKLYAVQYCFLSDPDAVKEDAAEHTMASPGPVKLTLCNKVTENALGVRTGQRVSAQTWQLPLLLAFCESKIIGRIGLLSVRLLCGLYSKTMYPLFLGMSPLPGTLDIVMLGTNDIDTACSLTQQRLC